MTLSDSTIPDGLQTLREQLTRDPDNLALRAQYFWLLHHKAKILLAEGEVQLSVPLVLEMGTVFVGTDKSANAAGWAVQKILRIVRQEPRRHQLPYEDFAGLIAVYIQTVPFVPGPDKMHSAMLWVATQLQGEEGQPWFLPLCKAIGIEKMQPEDFEGKVINGYPLPSLAERVVIAVAKFVVHERIEAEGAWALAMVEYILARKPQNIWLKNYRGRLLIVLGRGGEAREEARAIVMTKRTEFWAWAIMGETYVGDDDTQAVAYLCRVISLKEDEAYLVGIRQLLATSLRRLGKCDRAKAEIERILAICQGRNLRPPVELLAMIAEPWYAETVPADNSPFYLEEARKADTLLFEDDPMYVGIVTNIDHKSRSCFITFRLDGSARYRYHRTPWDKNLPASGTAVLVRVRERSADQPSRCEAVSMQLTDQKPDHSFAKTFSGSLKVISKVERDPIGFVGDVFVPGSFLKEAPFTTGLLVQGIAVKEMNRARGEYGWRAVRLSLVENTVKPGDPLHHTGTPPDSPIHGDDSEGGGTGGATVSPDI